MKSTKVFIVSGDRNSGKTAFMQDLYTFIQEKGYCCSGIISPSVVSDDGINGYRWLHLPSKRTEFLALSSEEKGWIYQDGYYYSPNSFKTAASMLRVMDSCLVILDEVGKLELRDEGWAPVLNYLTHRPIILVLCIQKNLWRIVQRRWNFNLIGRFDVGKTTPQAVVEEIIKTGEPALL